MASDLEKKIKDYWTKIENLTLDTIKSIKDDDNQSYLLLRNKFKDFFVRSTNLRVATMLEQFLIEDQLFHCGGYEMRDNVNGSGYNPHKNAHKNGTNVINIDGNSPEHLETFDGVQVHLQHGDAETSPNVSKIRINSDYAPPSMQHQHYAPSKMNIIDINNPDGASHSTKPQQQVTAYAFNKSNLHGHSRPETCHTNPHCHHGVKVQKQNPKPIDVDLIVHGVHKEILSDVERGATSISLYSRKRPAINASQPTEIASSKRIRMSVNAATGSPSEFDGYSTEQLPSPSPSPPLFKPRATRPMHKRVGPETLHVLNRFDDDMRETMMPYNEQALYRSHPRNANGFPNQRAGRRSYSYEN